MESDLSQVTMVGTFPPPVHGMAAVNAAVLQRLRDAGARVVVLNTAPASLDRGVLSRLGRLPRVLRGLARLACTRHLRGTALYIGAAGGIGQTYDLTFLLIARLRRMRVFVHHHSFAYLHQRRRMAALLGKMGGRRATHIAQSDGMVKQLRMLYGMSNIIAVSNAVFLVSSCMSAHVRLRNEVRVLGFLGNLAAEKGIFEFLDLMTALQQSGSPLRGWIAGPFQDIATEVRVRQRLKNLPTVNYAGAKYGAEKDAFFDGIDALVFPTLYANEAEPLVIHEAMQQGVPVIAYARGCIPEVVSPQCGCVIRPEVPFVPEALAQVEAWMRDPEQFQATGGAASARFAMLHEQHSQRWQAIEAQLLGRELPPGPA